MPSPFPGMNPFLEQSDAWSDFQINFMVRIRELLNDHVGPSYFAKLEVERSAQERRLLPAVEMEKHRSIEIRDRRDRRLVTVIELLSPANKTAGSDRDDYMVKRRQVLSTPTHLVEIDLRRGGARPAPPDLPQCDFYVLVSRHEDRPRVGVWPFGLRDPMPKIPVPLLAPDEPIWLDLKAVLDRTYDAGGYAKYIYQDLPEPPLTEDQMQWAQGCIPRS